MELLVSLTIIGFTATATMVSFMWMATGLGKEDVDMVKATGSIYTKSLDNAFVPGLIIQFTSGILITYVYGIFLGFVPFDQAYVFSGIGVIAGLFHGIIVSMVLKNLLTPHHPVEEYRKFLPIAFAHHIKAHIVFGLVIGTMYGTFLVGS